jgi:DNA-directed RNA polymerase specialized sigma24 family protein
LFVDDLLAARRFRLFRTALAWSGSRDLAEDLAQNTLIKAASSWQTPRDPANVAAWLFSILTNNWRMHLRSQREFESLDDMPEDFLIDERTP